MSDDLLIGAKAIARETKVSQKAKRSALILQSDATRLFKAARDAGYARARLITHPDGRIEMVGEDSLEATPAVEQSPFEQWKSKNAR